jgi:hypothetical protein
MPDSSADSPRSGSGTRPALAGRARRSARAAAGAATATLVLALACGTAERGDEPAAATATAPASATVSGTGFTTLPAQPGASGALPRHAGVAGPTATPVERPTDGPPVSLTLYLRTPPEETTCPGELFVTDPAGRRVGVEPGTGNFLREIRGAQYDEEGIGVDGRNPCGHDDDIIEAIPKLHVRAPGSGDWEIRVVGRTAGNYTIVADIEPADWRARTKRVELGPGTIAAGEVATHRVRVQ